MSGLCDLQPCLYTDVDGQPTMYASGRPAWHMGGDASIDTTGRYLNEDGSSSWPDACGALDAGYRGPSLPHGSPGEVSRGFFETVETRTGLGRGTALAALGITGLTVLLMSRNPKHWLEIAAAGTAGVALSIGVGTKAL